MVNLTIDYTPNVDSQPLTAGAGDNYIDVKLGAPVLLTSVGMQNSDGYNCLMACYLRLDESASRFKNIWFIPYSQKTFSKANFAWTGRQRIGSPYVLRFEFLTCTAGDRLVGCWSTQEIE